MDYLRMTKINEVLEKIESIWGINITKEILRKFIRNSGYLEEYDYKINVYFSSNENITSYIIYKQIVDIRKLLYENEVLNDIEDLTIMLDDNLYNTLINDKDFNNALVTNNITLCGIKIDKNTNVVNKKVIAFTNLYNNLYGLNLEFKKSILKGFNIIDKEDIQNISKKSSNPVNTIWIEKDDIFNGIGKEEEE